MTILFIVLLFAVLSRLFSIRIVDGDSLRILDGDSINHHLPERHGRKRIRRCRLRGIDAPEWSQPQGPGAQKALAALVKRRRVLILCAGRDRYGRSLAWLRTAEGSVNRAMVRQGWAFSTGMGLLPTMIGARILRRGMWRTGKVVRPDVWRQANAPAPTGGRPVRVRVRPIDLTQLFRPKKSKFLRGFAPARSRR